MGPSPFRDERLRSVDRHPDCFVCGRPVDPHHHASGTYGPALPSAPALDLHLPCLDGRDLAAVNRLYRKAILEIAKSAVVH